MMIMSAVSFAIMAAFVKATLHSVEVKAFSRQIVSCIFILAIIIYKRYPIIPKKRNYLKLLLRCFFGTLGIYLYFYSIDNLLLANASMLTRLSPFFVTIFAFLFLKESINKTTWMIYIPMLIGCILIIKPNSNLFNPASIYAIIAACSGALAYIMIRLMGKDENVYTIIFWFTVFSSIIYFIYARRDLAVIEEVKYLNLILIGLFGLIGQIGLTVSYQISKASYVAPYSYFYIIFSGILGYILWSEVPDMSSIAGYILIIISYLILMEKNKG